MRKPRELAHDAYQVWLENGRDAAIEHIKKTTQAHWRKYVYTLARNWYYLRRDKERRCQIKDKS